MSFGPELVWNWSESIKQLVSRKIQKIDGAGDKVIATFSGGAHLLLSWGAQTCGAVIVSETEKKALTADAAYIPPLTNALKSHLNGAELVDCRQVRRDKILEFSFRKSVGAGFASERTLVFEIMERYSNLILLDENGTILEAAKHIHPADNAYRSVLPGQTYALPPVFNGIPLENWLTEPSTETLAKISGIGAPLLQAVSKLELQDAQKYLADFYAAPSPLSFVPQRLGKYVTIFPVLLEGAESIPEKPESIGAVTTLQPLLGTNIGARRRRAEEKIKREIKRREKQAADIEKLLAQNPEELRMKAEAIISNLWQIKQGEKEVSVSVWDEEGKLRQKTVALNPALSPQQNAAELFKKYKKIAASQKRASALLEKVKEELEEYNEQLDFAALIDDADAFALIERELGITGVERSKKKKKEEAHLPPHKRFDLAYALVFVGLSAKGNRFVTFQTATPDDFWFHAQGLPGAHVILRFNIAPGEKQILDAIDFCASLAAWYSKARESGKVRVDFTKRKYVSPIKGGIANVTYKEFESTNADPRFWKEFLAEKS